jgi:hypothetical protein
MGTHSDIVTPRPSFIDRFGSGTSVVVKFAEIGIAVKERKKKDAQEIQLRLHRL